MASRSRSTRWTSTSRTCRGDERRCGIPARRCRRREPARLIRPLPQGPVTGLLFSPAPALESADRPQYRETTDCHEEPNGLAYAVVLFCHLGIGVRPQQHHGDERRRQRRDTQEPAPALGICVGFTLMLLLVGLGFGQLFTRFPNSTCSSNCAGTHLLYLAWFHRPPDGRDG